MNITDKSIIGELVANDYRTASVFKKYNLDFCCQGNRTIQDACDKKNIDSKNVLEDLVSVIQSKSESSADFKSWPLDLLADYIEKKHHRYVEAKTQEIKPYLDKICKVHGTHHPELFEIQEHFNASAGELAMHMKKEELVLFPFVRKLVQAKQRNKDAVYLAKRAGFNGEVVRSRNTTILETSLHDPLTLVLDCGMDKIKQRMQGAWVFEIE